MYKAIFIDLDGTLIRKDHSLSQLTIHTIAKAKEKGYLVVLVSARPLSGMLPIATQLDLAEGPLASLNGAYISINQQILLDVGIPASLTRRIHDLLLPFDPTVIYYHQDQWFCDHKDYYTDYEQRITHIPVTIEPFEKTISSWEKQGTGPNKLLVVTGEDRMADLRAHLSTHLGEELTLANSKTIYLEVMARAASKLQAIRWMIDRFGIAQSEVIAIGDNYNDREMIEFAGCGIAMGNAPEAIRAVADYVTTSNNEDGVARALIKILNW